MHKLQVLPTVKHVLFSTLSHFGFAFHISWPWMLALLPLNVAVNLYAVSIALTGAPTMDPYFIALSLLLAVASTVAFSSIAVSWHRFILLDETPYGWRRLRIDGVVWSYVGNTLLIVLILSVASFAVGFIMIVLAAIIGAVAGSSLASVVLVPVIVAGVLLAITTTFRMMIKLPAVALGRRDYTLGYAWRDSTGNF